MAKKIEFELPKLSPPTAGSGGCWTLAEDWVVKFRGEEYRVAKGFGTDGASIPEWLWFLCGHPLAAPRIYAAIVHDWLYSGKDPEATRAEADDIYRDIQIALGVERVIAYVEWAALRIFGGSHWTKLSTTEKERNEQ